MTQARPDARRPKVAVVSCYFPLFEKQMPPGFRQDREATARGYAELLARDFDVVDAGTLASDADGERANALLREARPDVVVFAPSMAAPPSYVAHALAGLDAPLVIWNAPTIDRLPDGLTQAQATVNSSQVAAVMLANPLVREARPFATVTASPSDADGTARLVRSVRAAAVASVLRGASVLRVGQWVPGYLDVESTAAELARLGVAEHAVGVEELDAAFDGGRRGSGRTRARRPRRPRLGAARGAGRRAERAARARAPRPRRLGRAPSPRPSTATRRCCAGTRGSGSPRASEPRSSRPRGSPSPAPATCRPRSRS